MHWWTWPILAIGLIILTIVICRWLRIPQRYRIQVIDILVVPMWYIVHETMGSRFGTSYVLWFLLIWWFVGAILAWFLMSNGWSFRSFWPKYWVWTGLLACVLLIIVTILGFVYH
ncbi:DUF3397 domain-containing protein [Leuconostoc citreum]|uniref:DUF3397 domain-containing protein n=1 Tax=Leuconostoc citreum TaxID=33964 RepID=UPI0032DE6835